MTGHVIFGEDTHKLVSIEHVIGTGNPDLSSTVSAAGITQAVTINLATGTVSGSRTGIVKVGRFEDIEGGLRDDTLIGSVKNNILDGGRGADLLKGNAGGDSYVVDNAGDRTIEGISSEIDLVKASVSWTLAAGLEWLALTGNALRATGNSRSNWLIGDESGNVLTGLTGNDVLWSQGGNDTLAGGRGADALSGGAGHDTYVYWSGDGTDLVKDSGGTDRLVLRLPASASLRWHAVDTGDADRNVDSLLILSSADSWVLIKGYFNNRALTATASQPGYGCIESIVLPASGLTLTFAGVKDLLSPISTAAAASLAEARSQFDTDHGVLENGAFAPTRNGTATADRIVGLRSPDIIKGGAGHDILRGQVDNDKVFGEAGNDILQGGQGMDALFGGDGNDVLTGNMGIDILAGGRGNDHYKIEPQDILVEEANEGIDTVHSSDDLALQSEFENATLTGNDPVSATGNEAGNVLLGNSASNRLSGLGGDDMLTGFGGADRLAGGGGADTFLFTDTSESAPGAPDRIVDFDFWDGDRINLRMMDANRERTGQQDFTFIGHAEFTAPGQVRFTTSGDDTYIWINTDRDASAEAKIIVSGTHVVERDWFVL